MINNVVTALCKNMKYACVKCVKTLKLEPYIGTIDLSTEVGQRIQITKFTYNCSHLVHCMKFLIVDIGVTKSIFLLSLGMLLIFRIRLYS